MARVPYREAGSLDAEHQGLVVSSLQDRPVHVYQAIANNPAVLAGLRAFLATLWADTGLTERERELAILATARAVDSTYEWHQHVRIAGGEGLDIEELDAIGAGDFGVFPAGEAALLRYATAVADGTVDDAVHDAAREAFGDDATLVGAAAVASGYRGLAHLIDALGVELEGGDAFVGWTPSDAEG